MQNLIFSLNATLPVFLVMVVGYALGQLGFLPHPARLSAQVCAVLLCRYTRRHSDRLGGG